MANNSDDAILESCGFLDIVNGGGLQFCGEGDFSDLADTGEEGIKFLDVDVFYFAEGEESSVSWSGVFVGSITFDDTDVSALWFFIEFEEGHSLYSD
jgi:hypothetical protein